MAGVMAAKSFNFYIQVVTSLLETLHLEEEISGTDGRCDGRKVI
jgi:hypothetical protein